MNLFLFLYCYHHHHHLYYTYLSFFAVVQLYYHHHHHLQQQQHPHRHHHRQQNLTVLLFFSLSVSVYTVLLLHHQRTVVPHLHQVHQQYHRQYHFLPQNPRHSLSLSAHLPEQTAPCCPQKTPLLQGQVHWVANFHQYCLGQRQYDLECTAKRTTELAPVQKYLQPRQ